MSKRHHCYEFPRPALTVDIAVFRHAEGREQILLVRRKKEPFAKRYALPGGFVDEMEPLEAAARRELAEETGLTVGEMWQLGAYGEPGRDPRGHTVSVVYIALTEAGLNVSGNDDASEARWVPVDDLTGLAFDHDLIASDALAWLRKNAPEGEENC